MGELTQRLQTLRRRCLLLPTSFEAQEYCAQPLTEVMSEKLTSCRYSSFTQTQLPPSMANSHRGSGRQDTKNYRSPLTSHHAPCPPHLSSDDRPHRSAACLHIQSHCAPSLQSVQRPHLPPVRKHQKMPSATALSPLPVFNTCLWLPSAWRKEGKKPSANRKHCGSQIHLNPPVRDPAIKLCLSIVCDKLPEMVDLNWMQSARKSTH